MRRNPPSTAKFIIMNGGSDLITQFQRIVQDIVND